MKKIILSVAALSAALAQAQVGINEEKPKATLDISVKKDNIDTNSQEGLLIPRVTKEKALKMANNTTAPEESVLIYVNDVASFTSPADEKVNDITEKGYYFWNGAKWVKSSGANGELWAQRENNGITETYLKPAANDGNIIRYAPGSRYMYFKLLNSDAFPLNIADQKYWEFNTAGYYVTKNHIDNANNQDNEVRYQGQFRHITTENSASRKISHLVSGTQVASLGDTYTYNLSSGKKFEVGTPVTSLNAGTVEGFGTRADNFSSGIVDKLVGQRMYANNLGGGESTVMLALEAFAKNRKNGKSNEVYGSRTYAVLEDGSVSDKVFGGAFNISAENSTIKTSIQGLGVNINLDNSTIQANATSHGLRSILHLKSTSSIENFESVNATFTGEVNSNIKKYYGYRLSVPSGNQSTITDMYGIYLDGVNKGSDTNYAIYTNEGNIRFGDLANASIVDDRVVTVDSEGVLKTVNTSNFSSKWVNETTDNVVKLAKLSDGVTERTNEQNVFITDDGKLGIGDPSPGEASLKIVTKSPSSPRIVLTNSEDDVLYGDNAVYGMSISPSLVGNGNAYIDFHTPTSSTDSFRGLLFRGGNGASEHFATRSIMALRSDNGRIGMGVLIPQAKLHVLSDNNDARVAQFSKKLSSSDNPSLFNQFITIRDSEKGIDFGIQTSSFDNSQGIALIKTGTDKGFAISVNNSNSFEDVNTADLYISPTSKNIGIATLTPTEKLDVNGKIKSSSLSGSGERLVTANNDGVLSTSDKTLADLESLWKKEASDGRIVLKENSAGVARTSTPGTDRNDVTIDDKGKITARGFIGYNGATIFPDYVFEKYYTGESTIKADYNFHNLASVESFIKTNGHLPGYTSAKEIAEKGLIDISATQLTNVEKIEELYLHTIEQQKQIEELKALVRGIK